MSLNSGVDYYFQARLEVLGHVPSSVATLLDVGCGGGVFASEMKKRQKVEVWGIEINQDVALQANLHLDRLLIGDATKMMDSLPDNYFDCIVCNDVLEHLYDPYVFLKDLRSKLKGSGVLICSIPNIRFIRVMKDLLFKKEWEYATQGVMDFTHVRFFTKNSIIKMFTRLDYCVLDIVGLNPKKVSFGFWVLDFILRGLLEDTRFPQFLCKVTVQKDLSLVENVA